jgi:methionine--tRNA ligase beta chain
MKPEVAFDAFEAATKLELVYGQVNEVEEIPKSDKLFKLTVNFGEEIGIKTICSAIKEQVGDPESIKGNGYFFVLNFAPRKMMGVLSEGMIVPFSFPDMDFGRCLRNSVRILPLGTKIL